MPAEERTLQVAVSSGTVAIFPHTGFVNSAEFNPDGTRIVTSSNDGDAKVWGVDGSLVATLEGHTGVVNSARFNPDGNLIVTANNDGTAGVWTLDGASS